MKGSGTLLQALLGLLLWVAGPGVVVADGIAGTLVASQACPATVSIRGGENPGGIILKPGESYRVVGANRADPTHYRLRFEAAEPKERWVAIDCGRLVDSTARPDTEVASSGGRSMVDQLVLAASWQPAFCETRPGRPECRDQTEARPDARRFSLHGLWPQPISSIYCDVGAREQTWSKEGEWRRLPVVALAPETRARLDALMPGTRSELERHQWIKHGTCYGTDPETYFSHSIALLEQLNDSSVRELFAASIGKRLRATEIRAAFDAAFGHGAGERVRLSCDGELIVELRIGLAGVVDAGSDLGTLILAAPKRSPECRGGWVDRAGSHNAERTR